MALLERVGTLLRANVNDLIARAEDPEKLARQLVLDMENQLLQVKTQVAIAIADQHLLQKKKKEHEDALAIRGWPTALTSNSKTRPQKRRHCATPSRSCSRNCRRPNRPSRCW